jgi:SAM-dependent methyltransferase
VQISKKQLLDHLCAHFDTVISATFSEADKEPKKVIIKPALISDTLLLSRCDYFAKKCITKNFPRAKWPSILESLLDSYRSLFIRFGQEEWHLVRTSELSFSLKKKALEQHYEPDFSHNRKKRHILETASVLPFALELGLVRADGSQAPGSAAKFTQINQFLEICSTRLPPGDELHIVDFGCGKAYLTFALYYYIHDILGRKVLLIGVDRNVELVSLSRALAKKVGFYDLQFVESSIADFIPETRVDMVTALHACDTASCEALAKAIHFDARALFVAPCCQHELSSQLRPAANPILLSHALFREHFASLLTDALRVRLLENAGYRVRVIEFVDPVHTPKNILIYGEKIGEAKKEPDLEYESFTKFYSVEPTLERLLRR